MPHASGPSSTHEDVTGELAPLDLAEESTNQHGAALSRGDLAWLDDQLTQIAPENGSNMDPERNISCDLSPGLPYAVINTSLHDDIHCSPADAIVTWLHNWDPDILEQFLDTTANETIHIEQKEEEEGNADGAGTNWTPVVVLDRIHEQIRVSRLRYVQCEETVNEHAQLSYFEGGSKAEYRVNVVEETGQWIPVHAVIDGNIIHGDEPAAKWAGTLITARILYEEAWKTPNRARLRVRFGGS